MGYDDRVQEGHSGRNPFLSRAGFDLLGSLGDGSKNIKSRNPFLSRAGFDSILLLIN